MNILLDRLHQKILNNDSLMKEVTESELLALVEAKEKQIPKKPIEKPTDDTCIYYENYCPNCENLLVVRYKHCPKCGQKLDW